MVLDQQIPLEQAFRSPFDLKERLGGTPRRRRPGRDGPRALAAVFSARPALHRFPKSMAGRVQEVCRVDRRRYGGDAAAIWTTAADGKELLANVQGPPRVRRAEGPHLRRPARQAARRPPPGWEKASAPFGDAGILPSVADIDSPEALAKVRQYKQQMKAKAKAKAAARRPTGPTAGRGSGRHVGPRPTGGSTSARPTDPTSRPSWRPASRAGSTSSSCGRSTSTTRPLVERAALAQRVCADHGVPFILNDRPDLAVGHRGRRRPRRPGRHVPAAAARRDDRARTPSSACRPTPPAELAGRPRGAGGAGRLRLGRPGDPDADQAGAAGHRPRLRTAAVGRSPWPVWVTGGVDPATVAGMVAAGARHFVVVRWLTEAADPGAGPGAARRPSTPSRRRPRADRGDAGSDGATPVSRRRPWRSPAGAVPEADHLGPGGERDRRRRPDRR